MPRGGRSWSEEGWNEPDSLGQEMQTFRRVAKRLAGGTDNDLLRVAAILIGIAPLVEVARLVGTDLPDLLEQCEFADRAIKERYFKSAAWFGAYCL